MPQPHAARQKLPRVILTICCRDEAELLASNIEFHLASGVSMVLVTDHRSSDRTPAILRHYERQGVVRWWYEPGRHMLQHRWVTRMAQYAARHCHADWVINTDTDEFWWTPELSLPAALAKHPTGSVLQVRRHDFVEPPGSDPAAPFFKRMTRRKLVSTTVLGTPLEDKVCHRATPRVWVGWGNHAAHAPDLGPPVATDAIEILHFPIRSLAEFERRVQMGCRACELAHARHDVQTTWWRYRELLRAGQLGDYVSTHNGPATTDTEALRQAGYIDDHRLAAVLSRDTLVARLAAATSHTKPDAVSNRARAARRAAWELAECGRIVIRGVRALARPLKSLLRRGTLRSRQVAKRY